MVAFIREHVCTPQYAATEATSAAKAGQAVMRNRGEHSRQGRNDWHQRAAEFHDLAAHAHRVAAMRHGQEDHQTGREHSRQAMEYSARAHQYSQEAHEKSESSFSKTGKTARIEPVKRANGVGKQSKMKA
jgi:hypothetical protein